MTILSKPFCLENFMNKFYSFQTEMNITNQHCFHNCRYLKEYLKSFNIHTKSVNGFIIMERIINGNRQTIKLEHNWLTYKEVNCKEEIIEPNKDINDNQYNRYFNFNEKKKMWKLMNTPKKEQIEDTIYQKKHLIKYLSKPHGLHLKYENMLWNRIVNKEICNEIKGEIDGYNMIEKLKQMGGTIIYM
jgi:hypothetical protein